MKYQQVIDTPLPEQTINESDSIENNHNTDTKSEILQRSTRIRKSAILDDYIVYLQECDYNIRMKNDPVSFKDAIKSDDSELWLDAMKDEMESMNKNQVQELVESPKGFKHIGCK